MTSDPQNGAQCSTFTTFNQINDETHVSLGHTTSPILAEAPSQFQPWSEMHGFLLNEDLSLLLLSKWIDFRSLGVLDMAITNRMMRMVLLQRLQSVRGGDVDKWVHSHSSMRWLITRGIRTSRIVFRSYAELDRPITDLTFKDINDSNVRHFALTHNVSTTDEGLSVVAHGCPLLWHINLSYCRGVTDVGISALAVECRLLESINLSGLRVTDLGVSVLGRGCPLLREIILIGCSMVTDTSVSQLGHGCPLLRRINLSRCTRITGDCLTVIAGGCPLLHSIDVSYCGSITDEGLSALARGCPLLQTINLVSCNGITDACVSVLALGCPLLMNIDFRGCHHVSNASIAALRDRWNLSPL